MIEIINKGVKENQVEFENFSQNHVQLHFSDEEKIHYLSSDKLLLPESARYPSGKSLFVESLHTSFANHIPFTVSPDSIWYIVSYEIATHIRMNQEKYRELFTGHVGKDTMSVRADSLVYGSEDNDWASVIDLFRTPISEKVPDATQQLLMLDFSTSTDTTRLAMLSIFMDMLSHYYEFSVFTMCGIPKIRITGTAQDWQKIIKHTEMLGDTFSDLKPYVSRLLIILKEILLVVEKGVADIDFWSSIYKHQSMSGGDFISGWINDLFVYNYSKKEPTFREDLSCSKFANIPTHISKVPFIWNYHGREISMNLVSGFLGVDVLDGYLTPQIGFGISESL